MIRNVATRILTTPTWSTTVSRCTMASVSRLSTSSVASTRFLSRFFASPSELVSSSSPSAPPANLRTLRHELSRMLDEDAAELAASPDEGLVEYLKEGKVKVSIDKEGEIRLTRQVGDYQIIVAFQSEADQDDGSGAGEEEEREQARAGQEGETVVEGTEGEVQGEGEGEDKYDLPAHSFEVDVINTKAVKSSAIRINAQASKQGEFVIDSIVFDPITHNKNEQSSAVSPSPADSMMGAPFGLAENELNRLEVADLSEDGQEKLLELMESLGVDDKLAQFVQHYSQVVRTQQYLDKLRRLKAFLA